MKFLKITAILCFPFISFAQSIDEASYNFRGPVPSLLDDFKDAKSISVIVTVPSNFEGEMHKFNAPVSLSSLQNDLFERTHFYTIKKTSEISSNAVFNNTNVKKETNNSLDGDIKVFYNIKTFEIVGKKEVLKAPAYVIGLETNLEIQDKEGNIVFKRNTPTTVLTYLVDPTTSLESLVNKIIYKDFDSNFDEFSFANFKQPLHSFHAIGFSLPKKLKNLEIEQSFIETFNQSVAVFDAIDKVDIDKYDALFAKARPFWEKNIEFNGSKDKKANIEVRYAANLNLATSYILVDDLEKASTYFPAIDENKVSSFFVIHRKENLEDWIESIKATKELAERKKGKFKALIEPEANLLYNQAENTVEKLAFNGRVINGKGEEFTGFVEIFNDNPPLIDWRATDTGSSVGNLMKMLKVEKNTVNITIEGEKKPKKMKMNDLAFAILEDGTSYSVDKVGSKIDNTDRYGMLKEVEKGTKFSLYKEEYPFNGIVLIKKNTEEDFFEIPSVFGRKKSLLKYFDTCPQIHEAIKQDKYLESNNQTYLALFEDANTLCN